jgi:hypothetical protein
MCFILFGAVPTGLAETGKTPERKQIKVWQPFWRNENGDMVLDAVVEKTTGDKKQGYEFKEENRFADKKDKHPVNDAVPPIVTAGKDDDVETCTRENWDNFPNDAGIALVHTHGNLQEVVAEATKTYEAATNWWHKGTGTNYMTVVSNSNYECHMVLVYPQWFKKHWKPIFDKNKAIVVMASCQSAKGNILDSVGGQLALGWDNICVAPQQTANVGMLLLYMDGIRPLGTPGSKRKSGDAFTAAAANHFIRAGSNKDLTTLCPSVENPTIKNVKPKQGPGAGESGDGFITFDTGLVTNTIPVNQALVFEIIGDVTISSNRWTGNNRIDFHYQAWDCETAYTVTVTAVAEKILGSKLGKQQLDGGDYTLDGVAPNEHKFTWTFSR